MSMSLLHNPERILISVRNVTKQKEALDNFEYLFNNTIEAIGLFQEGKCVNLNQAGIELFGFKDLADSIGKTAFDFIAPDSHEFTKERLGSHFSASYEANAIKRDGTVFAALIKGQYKVIDGIDTRVVSLIDLSALKAKEKPLR